METVSELPVVRFLLNAAGTKNEAVLPDGLAAAGRASDASGPQHAFDSVARFSSKHMHAFPTRLRLVASLKRSRSGMRQDQAA